MEEIKSVHICEITRKDFVEKWQEAEEDIFKDGEFNDVTSRLISFMGCLNAAEELFPGSETKAVFGDAEFIERLAKVASKTVNSEKLNPEAGFVTIMLTGLIVVRLHDLLFLKDKEAEA